MSCMKGIRHKQIKPTIIVKRKNNANIPFDITNKNNIY